MKVLKSKFAVYTVFAVSIVILSSLLNDSSLLLTISSACGVIYALLIARNQKIAFLFGIINVSTYGYILSLENLYGGVVYNIFYSLPMLIWGYFHWKKVSDSGKIGIKKYDEKTRLIGAAAISLIVLIYALILNRLGGDNVFLDSLTSIFGYVGIYLMTNKYIEQWHIWIISNFANAVLWFSLTIEDITNLPLLVMWIIYTINSLYGSYNWHILIKKIKE